MQDNLEKQKTTFKEWDEKYKLFCKAHGIEERKPEDNKLQGHILKRVVEKEDTENNEDISMIVLPEKQQIVTKEIVNRVLYEDVMNYGNFLHFLWIIINLI